MSERISASIVSAEKIVLEEEVESILLPGMMGDFMVLPNHGDCISSLRPGFLEAETDKNEKKRLFISGGIIEVLNNNVSILVDSAIPEEEVNSSLILDYIDELEQSLASESVTNKDDIELRKSDFNEVMKSVQNR
ncbi:ATP synthase F1 subunit epsilon [bacterium TMED277]|nr:MAG: ATP synthase F1 subunit epsilon [bacterium TMED277]